jgi:hypothetical protein
MKQHFTFCMGQSRIVSKNEGGRESVNISILLSFLFNLI